MNSFQSSNPSSFDRRSLLGGATAALLASRLDAGAQDPVVEPVPVEEENGGRPRLLVLGGTRFLGPAVVETALEAGFEVTLFNRGRSNPHLFPKLEKLVGDRDPDVGLGLSALEGRTWEAVIDTSAFVPRIAAATAKLLAGSTSHYVLVSTVSVYEDLSAVGIDENAELATVDDPTNEDVASHYGPLKGLCEKAVNENFPGRVTIARPGLIVGPRDETHRFSYWPLRVRTGGEILVPGDGDDPVQYIDVRDLARFLVGTTEREVAGTFNIVGPQVPTTMAELAHGCKAVTAGDAQFTWIGAEFLREREVRPWVQMPVWVPRGGTSAGIGAVDHSAARAAGLSFTPLAETVRDTLRWIDDLAEDDPRQPRLALAPERESEILAEWQREEG